jgi:6-pyruvoyltetrahydropterin/6-carboxytetrahydropterin synthase
MHRLSRQVRFSVNPFSDVDCRGYNSFTSNPTGRGIAIYLELEIGVIGQAQKDTGFVVNIVEIDRIARQYAVPFITEKIKHSYRQKRDIDFAEFIDLLRDIKDILKEKFDKVLVGDLALKLNPYRKVSIDCEADKMIYFSEKFEFAAMHKLWNDDFSEQKNFDVFGKCANPSGHGHNYVLDVTVKTHEKQDKLDYGKFEKLVDENFIQLLDHKNLNADTEFFKTHIPTVENIAVFAWENLEDKFSDMQLHSITVWETDRTSCTYYG